MATKYLDQNGLLYLWQKLKAAFATKSQAITNITRSGTTFTATKADNSTFTFDQQDTIISPYTSNPAMDGTASAGSSSNYAKGDHVHPTDTSRAPLASPAFTGNPTAPTQLSTNNSTRIATTAFVHSLTDNKANLASPAFTGTPTAPTQDVEDDSTAIATTAFVKLIAEALESEISGLTGMSFSIVQELPQTGSAGTVYLVPMASGSSNYNGYIEYIYVSSKSGNVKWEKIGTLDIDLSGYVQTSDLVAVTNAEIDMIVAS